MTRLSQSALNIIRTRPQRSRLFLSVFQPRTVMQAQVNSPTIVRGAYQIAYNSVSLGSSAVVEAGMTLLVGTVAGGEDLGRVRIRSITASQITVAENSHIAWADRMFLTVLRTWEIWPIFPRVIQDPNNPVNVLWYKDYDLTYSNQNSILGVFPNAGPHQAVFLSTGSATAYWSSSGTYNVGGSALSYYWTFEGGTPTGSNAAVPGNVVYSTPGHYVTRLTISGSNGAADVTYRDISVYDRPDKGNSPPILNWELGDISGSRSEGGYTAKITIRQPVTFPIREGSVVVIFSENWYGATQQSLGGNSVNNEGIFFVGYILADSIKYNWRNSTVEFSIGSATEMMKVGGEFSISTEDNAAPTQWYQLKNSSIISAIYHYLKWHSTVMMSVDVQPTFTDKLVQYFDTIRSSLYKGADDYINSTNMGELVADRQSKLWMEQKAAIQLNATGTFIPTMTLGKPDWINEPAIAEIYSQPLSYLEIGGVAYSGIVTGTSVPLLAAAPGNAPAYRGDPDDIQGLVLNGQSDLNVIGGNAFAERNARYPTVEMDLSGNFSNVDIAPQEALTVVIAAADTVRNAAINAPYTPDDITWVFSAKNQTLLPKVTLKALTSGPPATTMIVPEEPTLPNFPPNTFTVPPIPSWSFQPVAFPNQIGIQLIVVADANNGLYYSSDFGTAVSPTWYQLAPGTDPTINRSYTWSKVAISKSGLIFGMGSDWSLLTYPGGHIDSGGLFYGQVGGSSMIKLLDWYDITGSMNASAGAVGMDFCVKDGTDNYIGMVLRGGASLPVLWAGNFTTGIHATLTEVTVISNRGATLTFGNGVWTFTTQLQGGSIDTEVFTYNTAFTSRIAAVTLGNGTSITGFAQARAGNSANLIVGVAPTYAGGKLWTSHDSGLTFLTGTYTSGTMPEKSLAIDETATYLMVSAVGGPTNVVYKSGDGGATVSAIASLGSSGTAATRWNFTNLKGQNLWLAWSKAGQIISYTSDFGVTWTTKMGNLLSLCPGLQITDLAVLYG